MLLTRLLNTGHHFPGFVYDDASLNPSTQAIEVQVRPRLGSRPRCSDCSQPATGYDQLSERRFEFIPVWGFAVLLLYRMRRVQCGYLRGQGRASAVGHGQAHPDPCLPAVSGAVGPQNSLGPSPPGAFIRAGRRSTNRSSTSCDGVIFRKERVAATQFPIVRHRDPWNVVGRRTGFWCNPQNLAGRPIEKVGAGSIKRAIKQGHAIRSIFGRSLVTHFIPAVPLV